jgi:hypothetical protein
VNDNGALPMITDYETGEISLAPDVAAALGGGPGFNAQSYGALGDGVSEDHVAIQAAIDAAAAAGGGRVFIPAGTYLLGASLVLKRGVSISGIYPGITNTHAASWDLGFTVSTGTILTYPGGVVFTQDVSAGVGTLAALDGVVVERLGFDDVESIIVTGATNKSGLCGSVVQDILASNVTGIALDFTNSMHLRVNNVKACCFRFIRFTGDYDSAVITNGPGNSWFTDCYAFISADGHDEKSVQLRTLDPNGGGTTMGSIRFLGLQVNRFASEEKEGMHLSVEGADAASSIVTCSFLHVDFEGAADKIINLNNTAHCKFIIEGINYEDCNTSFYQRASTHTTIESLHSDLKLDSDVATSSPLFYSGYIEDTIGSGQVPAGLYYDASVLGYRLSGGDFVASDSVINDQAGTWSMPYAKLDFNRVGGGISQHYINWDADSLTADITFFGIIELPHSGNVAVTLMSAVGCKGQTVTLKKTGATGTVTVTGASSQTIDGASNNTWLDTQYKFLIVQSDGSNWLVVGKG